MAATGLGEVEAFPFLEPPDRRSIADGRALLEELGAFEPGRHPPRLTEIGRRLARLPIDPRLGRMVLEAERRGCLREVTVIAAALSIQDPRERPTDQASRPPEMPTVASWWPTPTSWASCGSGSTWPRCRPACRATSSASGAGPSILNVLRIREWQDVAGQIRQMYRADGDPRQSRPGPRRPGPPGAPRRAAVPDRHA